jgi:hypothetical protein
MKIEDLIIGKDYLYKDYKSNTGCPKRGRIFTYTGYHRRFKDKFNPEITWDFSPLDMEDLKDPTYNFNLTRFLINFLKALAVFLVYGIGTYLVFELLNTYAVSFIPYLIWVLLGLLVVCICALAASFACHVEGKK